MNGQLHVPAALPPGKEDRRLGGTQSSFGCNGEEKNLQPLLGLKPLIIPLVVQHYTTELSQLNLWKNFS
jgi:hypothetical protein